MKDEADTTCWLLNIESGQIWMRVDQKIKTSRVEQKKKNGGELIKPWIRKNRKKKLMTNKVDLDPPPNKLKKNNTSHQLCNPNSYFKPLKLKKKNTKYYNIQYIILYTIATQTPLCKY